MPVRAIADSRPLTILGQSIKPRIHMTSTDFAAMTKACPPRA